MKTKGTPADCKFMVSRCFFYLFSEIYLRISFFFIDVLAGQLQFPGNLGIAFILIKVHGQNFSLDTVRRVRVDICGYIIIGVIKTVGSL